MKPVIVLLPAYNEEEAIGPLLEQIRDVLRDWSYRVIVVDDGSEDATIATAERYLSTMPLEIVRRPHNGGLGAAMDTGIRHVRKVAGPDAVLVTMDADNTQDPAIIPHLVTAIEAGADLVIASRFAPGAGAIGVPVYRQVLSGGASLLFGVAIGALGVKDYTCGYRCYRLSLIERLARRFKPLVRAKGFAVMTELLAKAAADGARCAEVPFVLRYDLKPGRSKLQLLPTLLEYARVLLLARLDALRTVAEKSSPGTRESRPN